MKPKAEWLSAGIIFKGDKSVRPKFTCRKKTREPPKYELLFIFFAAMVLLRHGFSGGEGGSLGVAGSFLLASVIIGTLFLVKVLGCAALYWVFSAHSYKYAFLSSLKWLSMIYGIAFIAATLYSAFLEM